MIVADANLLVYLHVPSDLSAAAEVVFDQDSEWVAPLLWRSEFRNALLGLIRQGALTVEIAQEVARHAELWMGAWEYPVNTDMVLELAKASGCSSYDCEYVFVAQHLDAPLITADRQILKAFPSIAIHPGKFAA
jgi:predicted nucleic acid-binding protein